MSLYTLSTATVPETGVVLVRRDKSETEIREGSYHEASKNDYDHIIVRAKSVAVFEPVKTFPDGFDIVSATTYGSIPYRCSSGDWRVWVLPETAIIVGVKFENYLHGSKPDPYHHLGSVDAIRLDRSGPISKSVDAHRNNTVLAAALRPGTWEDNARIGMQLGINIPDRFMRDKFSYVFGQHTSGTIQIEAKDGQVEVTSNGLVLSLRSSLSGYGKSWTLTLSVINTGAKPLGAPLASWLN